MAVAEPAPVGASGLENWRAQVVDRLHAVQLQARPYQWALIDEMLGSALSHKLMDEFPSEGFRRSGNRPDYAFWYRGLIDGETILDGEPPISGGWREMATFLSGVCYREAMEQVLGLSLKGLTVFGGFAVYPPTCTLRPHPDRRRRVLTQTIYFNEGWPEDVGGSLLILRSNRWTDVYQRVSPTLGRSVIFVRSDHSWHAVERVRHNAPNHRRSFLLHFSR